MKTTTKEITYLDKYKIHEITTGAYTTDAGKRVPESRIYRCQLIDDGRIRQFGEKTLQEIQRKIDEYEESKNLESDSE